MKIRTATIKDFPAIAKLICYNNRIPSQKCLHSSLGEEHESLLGEIEKWHDLGEILFIIAQEEGQICGVIGSEYDESLSRGWLWGLHVSNLPWQDTAGSLFAALVKTLQESIKQRQILL